MEDVIKGAPSGGGGQVTSLYRTWRLADEAIGKMRAKKPRDILVRKYDKQTKRWYIMFYGACYL